MTDNYDKDENKQISNCLKLKDKFCNTRESFGNFIDINVLIFRIGLFLKFVMLSSTYYVNIMTLMVPLLLIMIKKREKLTVMLINFVIISNYFLLLPLCSSL